MANELEIYVEAGSKRAFAVSLDWPGWCRRGKQEEDAIEALLEAGPRYKKSLGSAASGLTVPKGASGLTVVERVKGDATTDFGAPSMEVKADERSMDDAEQKRQEKLLRACWKAFDGAGEKAVGVELRKGPRGGGRDLDKIIEHVFEAGGAYLKGLGSHPPKLGGRSPGDVMGELREAIVTAFRSRAKGEPPERAMRAKPWSPRYFVRRSAWHAIDHSWEIEDRSA